MTEKFSKPNITYKPKRIKSEKFGVPPYFTFYCEYHKIAFPDEEAYNDHMAQFHPGQPKDTFGDLKPFDEIPVRDFYPIDEREKIDAVLDDIKDIQDGLNKLNEKIENKLENISIPYNKNDYPNLYEAHHCPICGTPSAPDKLTYDDFKLNKSKGREAQEKSLEYTDNQYSVKDMISNKDKWLSNSMTNMATLVLKQIMKWVFELLLKIFWPLRFLLKKKAMEKMKDDIETIARENDITLGDLDPAVGPNTTMQSLGNTDNFRCLIHKNTFDETARRLLEEEQPEMYMYMDMSTMNHQQISNIENMVELISTQVEPDYETSNGLKFREVNGNKVDEDLRSRRGEGRLDNIQPEGKKGFVNGAINVGLKSTREFMERLDFMFDEWYDSEEVLCCFIYNLLIVVGGRNFIADNVADALRTLQGILEIYRNLLMVDWKGTFLDELNLIIELVNKATHQILETLINTLTGEIRETLDKFLRNALTLKGGEILRRCPPFDDLFLDALPDFIQDLLQKLNSYLKSFWDGFDKVPEAGKQSIDTMKTLLKLTAWIKALEKMISFLDFWAECTEDLETPSYDEIKDAVDKTENKGPEFGAPRNLQNFEKKPTINKSKGLETIQAEKLNEFRETLRQNMEPNRSVPFTSDTVKLLLTNFMGLSPEVVDSTIEDVDGECRCKNGFRPEEIETLKDQSQALAKQLAEIQQRIEELGKKQQ